MKEIKNCPLCGYERFEHYPYRDNRDTEYFNCERCGEYSMSWEFLHGFHDLRARISDIGYILSGLSRELHELKENPPLFSVKSLDSTLKHYLIPDVSSIEEKSEKLITRLKERTTYFGEEIILNATSDYSLAYAKNENEFRALFAFLNEKKFTNAGTDHREYPGGDVKVRLMSAGWNLSLKLGAANKDSEKGFIAIWFDEKMNDSIHAIETAISDCNYKPICIRDEHFSEKIMDKALGEIRRSRFVIVDLTGHRGSVFFEAGFAFGLGIETIYVYKETNESDKSPLEFYTRHYQCYRYQNPNELKEIVKDAIRARIKH